MRIESMAGRKRDPSGYSLGNAQSAAVAERVRALMAKRDLTQSALVEVLKKAAPGRAWQQGWISNLLAGKRHFQRWHVVALATALGSTEGALLGKGLPLQVAPHQEQRGPATTAAERDRIYPQLVSDPSTNVPMTRDQWLAQFGGGLTDDERAGMQTLRFSTPVDLVPSKKFWDKSLEFVREVLADRARGSGGPGR